MMELVDMLDLGSSASRRGGSTPSTRTKALFALFLRFHFCKLSAFQNLKYFLGSILSFTMNQEHEICAINNFLHLIYAQFQFDEY